MPGVGVGVSVSQISVRSFAGSVPAATVEAQSATMGALDLATFAGYQIVDSEGSAVTGVSDAATGTASGYDLSAGGLISSSTNGSLSAQDGNTIDITCDQGTATITLDVLANTYVISPTEGSAAASAAFTADAGSTIKLRSGDYGTEFDSPNELFKNKTPTSRITVESLDAAEKAEMDEIDVNNSDYLTFKNIRMNLGRNDGVYVRNASGATEASRVIFDGMIVYGPEVPVTANEVTAQSWDIAGDPNDYTSTLPNNGMDGQGAGYVDFLNCTVRYAQNGITNGASGGLRINGCDIAFTYGDAMKATEIASGHPTYTEVNWNFFTGWLAKSTDGPGIHNDGLQFQCNGSNAADWTGIEVNGNVGLWQDSDQSDDVPRGAVAQMLFGDDKQSGYYLTGREIGNAMCGRGNSSIGAFREAKGCFVCQNGSFYTAPGYGIAGRYLWVGNDTTSGTHTVRFNVAEGFTVGGVTTDAAWRTANFNYLLTDDLASYQEAFVGDGSGGFEATTKAEVLAYFKPKADGPLDPGRGVYIGPIAPDSIATPWVDFDNRTIDLPYEEDGWNPSGEFTDQTDVGNDTIITSNKVQISGASATGALLEVSGGRSPTVKVYESDGTTERWAHGGTCVGFNDDWVEIQDRSSVSTSATTNITLTAGTQTETWSITTSATDTAPPALNSTSPTDDAVDIAVDASITATFSESIAFGTGNIVLRENNGGWSDLETFDVTTDTGGGAGTVSISGTTLTIEPTSNLSASTEYAIRIAATAIDDAAGNSYAGIADDTTWSFTTAAAATDITRINTNGAVASSASIPSPTAGDLIVVVAGKGAGGTLGLPSGYTRQTAANTYCALYTKVSDGTETTVAVTNATAVAVALYRPPSGYTIAAGDAGTSSGTSATPTIPALTLDNTDGTSWVVVGHFHRQDNPSVVNFSGVTEHEALNNVSTRYTYLYDSDGEVASYSGETGVADQSDLWATVAIEVKITAT